MTTVSIKEALLNRRMLICIFTGFASGMPLYLLISLVPAWLRTEGVGLAEIGFFALIGLPYTWKFLWSVQPITVVFHARVAARLDAHKSSTVTN